MAVNLFNIPRSYVLFIMSNNYFLLRKERAMKVMVPVGVFHKTNDKEGHLITFPNIRQSYISDLKYILKSAE